MTVAELQTAGAATSRDDSPQWKAELLQLFNWGGFHGYNLITLDGDATLISGGSGTGKSTLMDAYIALMMPHTVPFNGASNAAKGRARGEDQRSVLSYMRGKTDTVEDRETGEAIDHLLRGKKTSVASGIAMTFRHDDGQRFTAARLMYAKASAVRDADVIKRWVTIPDLLDLQSVYEFSAEQFPPGPMKARYRGMRTYDSYDAFSHALFISLSIGSRGEGENALKLLSRIQSGHHESTVDDLYKRLVLERPTTYDEAEKVVAHFDDLSQLYDELRRDQDQIDTLSDIPEQYDRYQTAQQARGVIASLRHNQPGDTPFKLWATGIKCDAFAAELQRLNAEQSATVELLAAAESEVRQQETRQEQLAEQIRANGGDALTQLEHELAQLKGQLDKAKHHRMNFLERTAALERAPNSADDFVAMAQTASEALSTMETAKEELDRKKRQAIVDGERLLEKMRELEGDLNSLLERKGSRIRESLSSRRDQLAGAAGLDRSQLPFIAELIDIHPDDERWRTAAEAVMGGFARMVVLDKRIIDDFTRRIDSFPPRERIQYRGVPLNLPTTSPADPRTLAGKLIFKDGPFKGWLQKRTAELFDHECVETPEELISDGRRRVSLSGQERRGAQGAHGVPSRTNYVIGFSNEELIATLRDEIADLTNQIGDHARSERDAGRQLAELAELELAYQEVLRTDWTDIDVAAVERKIQSNEEQQQQILAATNILAALRRQKDAIDKDLNTARSRKFGHESRRDELAKKIETFSAEHTVVAEDLARQLALGAISLTDDQKELLTVLLADEYTGDAVEFLGKAIDRVHNRLTERGDHEADRERQARQAIEKAFHTFQSRWRQYDWGTDIESYPNYRDHYDALVTTGLAEHRDQFAKKVTRWSGADLVELRRAFRNAKDGIETRLDAVNRILNEIPFGAKRDRLHIRLRHRTIQLVKRFTAEMEEFASAATSMETEDLTSEEIEQRYRAIQNFIKYLLPPERLPKGEFSTRDELLDVRRHVAIIAERVDKDSKEPLSSYNSLGGKSGGETQELMAFIVGAALRYQLGDESRTRPRFAPVLLDEGFIKADAQFAGRAVEAWRKLGFQLIVGSVIDKVSAIEPYVSHILQITKSPEGYSHVTMFDATTPAIVTQDSTEVEGFMA
ncbi:SbcC/MukB-like Walker B domain-containing protein [Mycobacterium sp. IS-3022]|uniref:ATP-binding protein n=1 Tax=Mycobacterium sp. IS-3022 TaxID=1772277 RepID=UPI0007416AFC|nr:SbcC/MukB-like Walker B domain-containing protein [Mycobacterium sp. IS-3022]KUI02634.1 hypothetical protein AU188_14595 [Mycobacterium sp. IS-3022]